MSVCGTGTGNFPQPGDPNDPSGLSVQAIFGGIRLTWTYPNLNPEAVAHTAVYRSTSSDPATKVLVQIVAGNSWFDPLDELGDVTYYYWIQTTSVHGTLGDLIGPQSATIQPTTAQMLAYLSGQITNSELGIALTTEIARIDGLENGLTAETAARVTQEGIFSTTLTAIQNEQTSQAALISSETSIRATDDATLASSISTVQTTVDGHTASIQTIQTVQDGIKAEYMVKLDVDGYVSGFGLYNSAGSSTFVVNADKFAIGKLGATDVLPFQVVGNVVYMNVAMIEDATITGAKIANATIVEANIQDGEITNAKIGDTIESTVWNPTTKAGWQIDKLGNITASSLAIYDGAGGLIFGAGDEIVTDSNPIDDVNITTFISGAAIDTAQIKDAAIDTLQLRDNAVTTPFTATQVGTKSASTSWKDLVSVTMTAIGGDTVVHVTGFGTHADEAGYLEYQILLDGVVQTDQIVTNVRTSVDPFGNVLETKKIATGFCVFTLAAGSHTIKVQGRVWSTYGNGAVMQSFGLTGLETAR